MTEVTMTDKDLSLAEDDDPAPVKTFRQQLEDATDKAAILVKQAETMLEYSKLNLNAARAHHEALLIAKRQID